MEVGKLIKAYREKNKMTQQQFGKMVGVNKQTVSKWEKGVLQPSAEKFFEIIQAMDLSAADVLKEHTEDDHDEPFVSMKRTRYNIGLNSLYLSIYDFKSLYWFVDAFSSVWSLLEPNAIMCGILLMNRTIEDIDAYDKSNPIISINCGLDVITVETTKQTLSLKECMISSVYITESYNNEVYGIHLEMLGDSNNFLQLILGFGNIKSEETD